MTNRAVFLDRDGVINQIVYRDGRPGSPRDVNELALTQGAANAVESLQVHGFRVFMITNQPEVARGTLHQANLEAIMDVIRENCAVDDVAICVHDDADRCNCRKPKPGMLTALAERWSIDLTRSFVVGDTWRDMEAGLAAGCCTLLIDQPYNAGARADLHVASLSAAVVAILSMPERARKLLPLPPRGRGHGIGPA
jgi:D-glycero-D-manno-heptose 1,7-bisphosphate phosphatase